MRKLLVAGLLFLALYSPPIVIAEVECKAQVSYKWKKTEGEEQTEDVTAVASTGADEAEAKAKLEAILPEQKRKAWEACRNDHENVAECMATKYTSMSSVISSLGFEARKSLEQAIASDCSAQQGGCTAVVVSESKCVAKEGAAGAGEAQGAADAKGKADEKASKDSKGKKK